jgi:hypothetical protein
MTRARILADYVSSGDELALKAPLAGPTFTGTVAIPNVANLETAVVANTAKVTNANPTLADINALDVTELGTVTSGTLGSAVVFPAGSTLGQAYLVAVDDSSSHQGSTTGYTLRILNTKVFEVGFAVTLVTNEFSFDEVGTYIINGRAPNYNSNRNIMKIMYTEAGGSDTDLAMGMAQYANAGTTTSHVTGKVVIGASHITGAGSVRDFGCYMASQTAIAGNGHGVNSTQSTTIEQYLQVTITKIQE